MIKILYTLIVLLPIVCYSQKEKHIDNVKVLKEVEIRSEKLKDNTYILGTYKEPRSLFSNYSFEGGDYYEVAVFIPNDGKNSIIKSILFHVHNLSNDSLYTITLYSTKSIIESNQKKKIPNKVIFSYQIRGEKIRIRKNIDISQFKIRIPENGIFVSFGGCFSYRATYKLSKSNTLFRVTIENKIGNWIHVFNHDDKVQNARFGLLMDD